MSQLQALFREEAVELLQELESALLELEGNPDDMELVARIFRAMHTVKGSGSMCDFPNIASFTHELETAFDRVRKGEIIVTKALVEIGLDSHSFISSMVDTADELTPKLREQRKDILTRLSEFSPISDEASDEGEITETNDSVQRGRSADEGEGQRHYRIRFVPEKAFLTYGFNPLSLFKGLSELGTAHVASYTDNIPDLLEIDETACYMSWEIIFSTFAPLDAITDLFSLVEEDSEVKIEQINGEDDVDEAYKKLGDLLIERGDLTLEQAEQLFPPKALVGEIIADSGLVSREKINSALLEQEIVREDRKKRNQVKAGDNVRVPSSKLDLQMDLVGELVIALASLNQMTQEKGDPKLTAISEDLDQLVTSIRDNVLGIRMLPIGSTFSKFKRLVRDLSNEQGKKIELATFGAETELDKTVIDQLSDPLVHLIRNSLDHGIEQPADRIASGKPEMGEIALTAKHSQGHVIIEIKDNGKGIDADVIWAKAVEKGLATVDSRPNDKDVLQYIFSAGFSTAENITNISGRGVGMDVVKRAIASLRGSIDIESTPGQGTTITLQLPLTLAIIEGLLVKVGNEALVIPLSMVEECVETHKSELKSSNRGQLIRVRDMLIPCLPLQNWVGCQNDMPDDIQIIIVSLDGEKYGLIVDEVIGQQQIVIKCIGSIYKSIKGVSGATILGDGSVALILDMQQIVQLFDAPLMA